MLPDSQIQADKMNVNTWSSYLYSSSRKWLTSVNLCHLLKHFFNNLSRAPAQNVASSHTPACRSWSNRSTEAFTIRRLMRSLRASSFTPSSWGVRVTGIKHWKHRGQVKHMLKPSHCWNTNQVRLIIHPLHCFHYLSLAKSLYQALPAQQQQSLWCWRTHILISRFPTHKSTSKQHFFPYFYLKNLHDVESTAVSPWKHWNHYFFHSRLQTSYQDYLFPLVSAQSDSWFHYPTEQIWWKWKARKLTGTLGSARILSKYWGNCLIMYFAAFRPDSFDNESTRCIGRRENKSLIKKHLTKKISVRKNIFCNTQRSDRIKLSTHCIFISS